MNELRKEKLIEKSGNLYNLTIEGKMYVATLDEADMQTEKLPKVSIALFPERINENGELEVLLSRRLKNPNYGKVVGIGGKVRFGETFIETAKREFMEETGLQGDFHQKSIVRKIGFIEGDGKHKTVLDIVFILFLVDNIQGDLKTEIADQENFWSKASDIESIKNVAPTVSVFYQKAKVSKVRKYEYIEEMRGY